MSDANRDTPPPEPAGPVAAERAGDALAALVVTGAAAALGVAGWQISTGGLEVTGGVILVTALTCGCHLGEWARGRFLRHRASRRSDGASAC